jgi:ADP-ribosylglycohydrolase
MQLDYCLLGAIAGDIIGSRFEGSAHKSEDFVLFTRNSMYTDDSVLTIAVADAILRQVDYGSVILEYARRYPRAGYGGSFPRMDVFAQSPTLLQLWERLCHAG